MWIKHRSPLHEMDWAGWALFGLVATAALTVIMTAAQLGGLSRLDLPLILGTLVTEDPDRARVAGFVIALAGWHPSPHGVGAGRAWLDRRVGAARPARPQLRPADPAVAIVAHVAYGVALGLLLRVH